MNKRQRKKRLMKVSIKDLIEKVNIPEDLRDMFKGLLNKVGII